MEENDVVNALTSEKHMIKLCNDLQNQIEGVGHLYHYFDVNGKAHELMKWAIEGDVATATSPSDLINEEGICYKLFFHQFYGDLAWKFFSPHLTPVVETIIQSKKLCELKDTAQCKWLVTEADKVVKSLNESLELCPLSLRKSFSVLLKALEKKFANAKKIVATIFFTKFVCPTIVNPSRYGLIGNEKDPVEITEVAKKGLNNFAKLLESFASGENIKDEPCAPSANDSMQPIHSAIIALIDQLVDEKVLDMMMKVVEANVHVPAADKQRAQELLETYYKEYQIMHCVGLSLDEAREEMLGLVNDPNIWRLEVANRQKQLFVYSAQKPNDPVLMFKLHGIFKAPLSKAYEAVYPDWNKFLESVGLGDNVDLIERLKDNISDWHVKIKGYFPMSPRDIIIRMQMKMGNNEFWYYGSSINRPDYPPTRKFVRAYMRGSSFHSVVCGFYSNDFKLIQLN